jgi:CheY-like chemotaxis protein
MPTQPSVLLVDDQPINVQLLKRALEKADIHVEVACNGKECLASTIEQRPDLILLDIMMPEMDGIEVCRRLRANDETKSIPIIFITARSNREIKLEGLEAGAVDFITKPIDLQETIARVKTQLRVQSIYRRNLELQERLAESRQTAAVGAITQGIAHNLNNLLGVAVGYIDLIKNNHENADLVLRSNSRMETSVVRMVEIVRQLNTIASMERLTLTTLHLQAMLEECVARFKIESENGTTVTIDNPLGDIALEANGEVFESILIRLLINAWESYAPDAEVKGIMIKTSIVESPMLKRLVISVIDEGNGIDKAVKDHIFDPFVSSKPSVGRGMGLTIARHSARNLGGDLTIESGLNGGTRATLAHPV